MAVIMILSHKPPVQNLNQIVKSINAEIRMRVLLEIGIAVVEEQHGSSASGVTGCHVVDAVADLYIQTKKPCVSRECKLPRKN